MNEPTLASTRPNLQKEIERAMVNFGLLQESIDLLEKKSEPVCIPVTGPTGVKSGSPLSNVLTVNNVELLNERILASTQQIRDLTDRLAL